MAKQVEAILIGADVSKAEVVLCVQGKILSVANERTVLRAWIRSLAGTAKIGVEATNTYHLALIEEAHASGHSVYVIDGYRLSRYRDSVGVRAKTDLKDAELMLRYLEREGKDLRAWSPPTPGYLALQKLLRRRAVLVQARVSLVQSFSDLPELKASVRGVLNRIKQFDLVIQKRIAQVALSAGASADIQRCQGIEGVGALTATALAYAFRRGSFSSSDAFIAFLGLDIHVSQSGTYRGKGCLTKKGDSEVRRLLYNAAMAARRSSAHWREVYESYARLGKKPIQILVIISRKLARIAFALMKNQTEYRPPMACAQT